MKISTSNVWKREKVNIAVTFGILFLTISFLISNDIVSNTITIGLWLSILAVLLLLCKGRLNKRIFNVTILLAVIMLVTTLVSHENFSVYLKIVFSFFVASIYVSVFSLKEFAISFVKVMRFFCIVSLIGYFLHMAVPGVFNLFAVQNAVGIRYSNWIFYIQYYGNGVNAMRNYGFAWEPGAFATCICLAMFLELLVLKSKIDYKRIGLYLITIITTFSTNGIVACILLCLYVIFNDSQADKRVKRRIAIACIVGLILILPFSDMFFDTSTNSTFGKLINYYNNGEDKTSSTSVRIYAITKALEAFIKKPIMGWGYDGLRNVTYEFTLGMNTCTFINWFAVYGIIFGSIMMTGILRFSKSIGGGYTSNLFAVLFLFMITMTENYVHNALILIIVLYGFIKKNRWNLETVPQTYI